MLVLSRKKNESVLIGDNIVVTVVEIKGNTVRLGFEAPRDMLILRDEVLGSQNKPAEDKQNKLVEIKSSKLET